jgi:hypothetical protein
MNSYPLTFRDDMQRALRDGTKTETRRPITSGNTRVLPGTFSECDLTTARIRTSRHGSLTEIRARCVLPSGPRVVTIGPRVQPGDVFWVRKPRGMRAASRLTLLVTAVHARRLQDMDDHDAIAEGLKLTLGMAVGQGRRAYGMLWDEIHGPGSWDRNDWVWVYKFTVQTGNVDRLYPLLRGGPRKRSGRTRRIH